MITIKEIDKNNAEIKIDKCTPHITMLLGIEMLIEALIESSNINIDYLYRKGEMNIWQIIECI